MVLGGHGGCSSRGMTFRTVLQRAGMVVLMASGLLGLRDRFPLGSHDADLHDVAASADHACATYRGRPAHAASVVCTAMEPDRRSAEAHARVTMDEARAAARRRDEARTVELLSDAARTASAWDRDGTFEGALLAGKLVAEILDVLEANALETRGGFLDARAAGAVLARASLESAAYPFTAERIHRTWARVHAVDGMRLDPHAAAALAAAIEADDARYVRMEHASFAGDVAGCTEAAVALTDRRRPDDCARVASLVVTGQRLAVARMMAEGRSARVAQRGPRRRGT